MTAGGSAGRVLVAGVGNIFLADDAFGPELVTALRDRPLPPAVDLADFGIRGMDLAYRLLAGYETAILLDAVPRGGRPGTLYVLEVDAPAADAPPPAPEAHGMDPVKVLAWAGELARAEGLTLPRVLVLGCEPLVRLRGDEPEIPTGLSAPVRAAVGEAVRLLESLLAEALGRPVSGARNRATSHRWPVG
ncbi:hydrogenase maturation protease [Streptomyces sp. NPDC052396]|uniref:hydrogenase maturation protease n=1 Tax=Streptomyces sp. NPDC052396 TaxID=3365689 RepID=UPI0037D1DFF2